MQHSVRVWAPKPTGVVDWLGAMPLDGVRLSRFPLHNVEPDDNHRAGLIRLASELGGAANRRKLIVQGNRSPSEDPSIAVRRARAVAAYLRSLGVLDATIASVGAAGATQPDQAVVIFVM